MRIRLTSRLTHVFFFVFVTISLINHMTVTEITLFEETGLPVSNEVEIFNNDSLIHDSHGIELCYQRFHHG